MDKIHILVAENLDFPPEAVALLERVGELRLENLTRPKLIEAIKEADILWVRLGHRIDAEILSEAPKLKMIVTPTTGLDHIDIDAARSKGIQIFSLKGETEFLKTIRATAEHTLALVLCLLRKIPEASRHALAGTWNRDLFKGGEIYGKTIGIVGYGRLGRIVANYFLTLGAQVLITDPWLDPNRIETGIEWVPLFNLLSRSDIVSLHVNLNEQNRRFFDKKCFEEMKPGSFFINTSRGELIDESALLSALKNGYLAGAGLDVLIGELEPGLENHPLLNYAAGHDHLIITPHIGGCTRESTQKTEEFLAQKVVSIIEKKEPNLKQKSVEP